MRRESLHVRSVVVCLFLITFILAANGQTKRSSVQLDKTSEGSLRVLGSVTEVGGLCPLKKTEVRAEISGFVSRVTVTQIFQNPYDRAIEALYTFPLPNDAAVDDLMIQIGDRKVRGVVLEKEEAKQTYEKAKQEGKVAALLVQQRPNLFSQAVANITPGSEIKVMIEYFETLKYIDDTYEFSFPMTIGDRYVPSSADPNDTGAISPDSEVRPGHTISLEVKIDAGVPIQEIYSKTHAITDQQFSATAHVIALRNEDEIPNRDFVLKYKTAGIKITDGILVSRDEKGGYFTLILQPPDKVMPADTMPKEIVFVMDTSGSMGGFPIEKAKEAMNLTLDHLNPSDTFNVITFAGETQIVFDGPVPATRDNLSRARKVINGSSSGGGTEMMKAIRAALEPSDSSDHVRIVCFMTDGEVGNEYEIISEVKKHPNARVFAFGIGSSVNHFLLDEISHQGRGEVEYVGPSDDGSAAAERFYERIRNPLLTDVSLSFENVRVGELLPASIPDVFDAEPVTVVGRYANAGTGKIVLRGRMQGQPYEREIPIELPERTDDNHVLATLWAKRKVSELMYSDLEGMQGRTYKKDVVEAITKLGVEYSLVTPFTSFVAVDERISTDGSPTPSISVPVAQPDNQPQNSSGPPINAQNYPPNPPGVGGVSASVEVTAGPGVNETSSISSSIITTQSVQNLPLNGRSVQSLVLLTPGTATATADANRQQTSLQGTRAGTGYFSVDGVSSNLGVLPSDGSLSRNVGNVPTVTASGGTNGIITSDATAEFTVRTMSNAEYGRTAGTQINVVSKAGTNEFHGSLFEVLGNDKLNANDFFANSRALQRAPSRLNQFGGTFGGYFVKDKSFFFGSYEGLRLRKSTTAISEVPTIAARQSASPFALPLLDSFALPNGRATSPGFAEFSATYTDPADHDVFSMRVDDNLNNKLQLRGRFNAANSEAVYRGSSGLSLNTLKGLDTTTNSFTGEASYTATASLIMTGRFNFSRNEVGQRLWLDGFGGAEVRPSLFDISNGFIRYDLIAQNAALQTGNPISTTIDQLEPSFRLSAVRNAHVFAFGAEYRQISFDTGVEPVERNFLFVGIPTDASSSRLIEISRSQAGRRSAANSSVFVQDDWRIKPFLTLNYGLRWETNVAPSFPDTNSLVTDTSTQMRDRFGDFAPRVGISYDVLGKGHSIIRGGIGLYFDQSNRSMSDSFATSYPFATGSFAQNNLSGLSNAFRPWILFADDLKTPHTWQAYAEFAQELPVDIILTASYQGVYGRDLLLSRPVSNATGDPFIAQVIDNSGRSNNHSGHITLTKRFSNGFSIYGRYTYAKSIDNFSADPDRGLLFVSSDLARERGRSDFDIRHDLSFHGSWLLPFPNYSGWVATLTRGWTVSTFVNAHTGSPINAAFTRANGFWDEILRPDLVAGVPVYRSVDGRREINPAAFSIPVPGTQGSLGRNALRGLAFHQVDLALSKQFRFAGESSLLLKMEVINLFNNANFADMEASLGTTYSGTELRQSHYFGRSLGTVGGASFVPFYLYGGARNIQLSAKVAF